MKNLLMILMLCITVFLITGCTDARRAKLSGYGSGFMIESLNCDGTVGRAYISTGKVTSEANSDGYYFMDKNTKKLVEVSGRVVITKL